MSKERIRIHRKYKRADCWLCMMARKENHRLKREAHVFRTGKELKQA